MNISNQLDDRNTNFEPQLGQLYYPQKNNLILLSRCVLQKTALNYYTVSFNNKILWKSVSLFLYMYLQNIFDLASWPAKPTVFTIWPFTEKVC